MQKTQKRIINTCISRRDNDHFNCSGRLKILGFFWCHVFTRYPNIFLLRYFCLRSHQTSWHFEGKRLLCFCPFTMFLEVLQGSSSPLPSSWSSSSTAETTRRCLCQALKAWAEMLWACKARPRAQQSLEEIPHCTSGVLEHCQHLNALQSSQGPRGHKHDP